MADSREQSRAEKAVIGCLLLDPGCIEGVNLSPEMFTGVYTRRIFEEFYKSKGEALDSVILRSRIAANDIPDEYFQSLLNEAALIPAMSIEADKYAAIVFEAYRERMLQKAIDPEKSNSQIIAAVEELTFQRPAVSMAKIAAGCMGKCFSPDQESGYKTGHPAYDNLLGGLRKKSLSVIGARTSVGKSAFAMECALNMAKKNLRVRYISTEMSREEVYQRLVSHESGIHTTRVQRADHFNSEQEADAFDKGNESLLRLDRLVVDDDIYTLDEVTAAMVGYDVVFIDYIQEIKAKGKARDRYEEIADICIEIRRAAKRSDCHVVLLSQLNRYVKDKDEPDIDNLSESDALGKSAAQVTLLWNMDDTRTIKGVKVVKNRHGQCGKISMKFDGAICTFRTPNQWKEASNEEVPNPFKL